MIIQSEPPDFLTDNIPDSEPAASLTEMDDTEIQATVESILGKGAKVLDCEKKSTIREEEVLLVNGCRIRLEGEEGVVIREALVNGTAPHADVLNQILIRAGILSAPVRLETSLSVKSSVVTREQVTVARGGKVVDGRSRESKEDNYYSSTTAEIWEPVPVSPPSSFTCITKPSSFSTSSSTSEESAASDLGISDLSLNSSVSTSYSSTNPSLYSAGILKSEEELRD